MQGRAPGPVVLRPVPSLGVAAGEPLRRPDVPRRGMHVGVLVADPADRPGRAAGCSPASRLGLDQARDLDAVVTATGAPLFGPALLDASARLLDARRRRPGGHLDRSRRPGRPGVRRSRRRPGRRRRGRPRRAPRPAPCRRPAPHRAVLAGGLRARPVGRPPSRRLALPAGHPRRGAGRRRTRAPRRLPRVRRHGRRVGRGLAQERDRRRPGRPRLRGPRDRGARHRPPAARDRPGAARRAGAGRDRRGRPRGRRAHASPSSAAAARCTPRRPGTAPTPPTWR